MYLNCPSCGLTLAMSQDAPQVQHCPRCLARGGRAVGLFLSAEPNGVGPLVQRAAAISATSQ